MGIIDKIVTKQVAEDPNKLTTQEIQMALMLLKQSTIKGEQVELFYSLVVKLQNQFLATNNQQ